MSEVYATKRHEVQAIQYTGENYKELVEFTGSRLAMTFVTGYGRCAELKDLEVILPKNWWITRTVSIDKGKGEYDLAGTVTFKSFSPEEFEHTYELVKEK